MEDKFDGIRAQLHAATGGWRFSPAICARSPANLPISPAPRAASRPAVILDGEIVAYEAGRRLTFFDLQKRLGRKNEDDLFLGRSDVPVVYQSVRSALARRRARCSASRSPRAASCSSRSPCRPAWSWSPIAASPPPRTWRAPSPPRARQRNEGLMVKDGASLYTPGRRGLAWLKFKKELATLDVVVVGAENGPRQALRRAQRLHLRRARRRDRPTAHHRQSLLRRDRRRRSRNSPSTSPPRPCACMAITAKCVPRSSSKSPSTPSSRATATPAASPCASRASKPSAATRRRRRSTRSAYAQHAGRWRRRAKAGESFSRVGLLERFVPALPRRRGANRPDLLKVSPKSRIFPLSLLGFRPPTHNTPFSRSRDFRSRSRGSGGGEFSRSRRGSLEDVPSLPGTVGGCRAAKEGKTSTRFSKKCLPARAALSRFRSPAARSALHGQPQAGFSSPRAEAAAPVPVHPTPPFNANDQPARPQRAAKRLRSNRNRRR